MHGPKRNAPPLRRGESCELVPSQMRGSLMPAAPYRVVETVFHRIWRCGCQPTELAEREALSFEKHPGFLPGLPNAEAYFFNRQSIAHPVQTEILSRMDSECPRNQAKRHPFWDAAFASNSSLLAGAAFSFGVSKENVAHYHSASVSSSWPMIWLDTRKPCAVRCQRPSSNLAYPACWHWRRKGS